MCISTIIAGMPLEDATNDDYTDIIALASNSTSTEHLLSKLSLSAEDIAELERQTVGQSKNSLWSRMRKGRITASNFYRVHTKMETLKRESSTDCAALIKTLIDPPSLAHIAHIRHGIVSESDAIVAVCNTLSKKHKNLEIKECGLYLHAEKQFLVTMVRNS